MLALSMIVEISECGEEDSKKKPISEPFTKSLHEFAAFNNDIQQKYRSIGLLDDFSNIVNNMIRSLQEVQAKGEDMVNKIRTQEAKLDRIMKEISDKEEHIKKVNDQMVQIENINLRIEKEVNNTEAKKKSVQNEIQKLEEKQDLLKQKLTSYSQTIKERKLKEEREIKKFKTITESKSQSIERLKKELVKFETKIAEKTKLLSDLEKTQVEKVSTPETETSFLRSEFFYPILLMSLLFNLVIGGQALNMFSPFSEDLLEKNDENFSDLDPIFQLTKMIGQKVLSTKHSELFKKERGERKTEKILEKKTGKTTINEVQEDPIQTLYNLTKKKRKSYKKRFQMRESQNVRDR